MLLKRLDDQTIIDTFITPIFKAGRRAALLELFSRNSKKATRYRQRFLRHHLFNDSLHSQPLTKSDLETLVVRTNSESETQTLLVWLAKLGYEPKEQTLRLLALFKPSRKLISTCHKLILQKPSVFPHSLYGNTNQLLAYLTMFFKETFLRSRKIFNQISWLKLQQA